MSIDTAISFCNRLAGEWLECAFRGLAAVAAASLVCLIFGRFVPVALRCWLWWLICLRLCLAMVGGLIGLPEVKVTNSTIALMHLSAALAAPETEKANPTANTDLTASNESQVRTSQVAGAVPVASATPRPTLAARLLLLWCSGVIAATGLTAVKVGRLSRLLKIAEDLSDMQIGAEMRELAVKMGVPKPPHLVASAASSAPFVTGLRRPLIAVPNGFETALSPDEVRMALAHELAHLRRGDPWLALVPATAQILGFCIPFLPGAICAAWESAREADCDARAITATNATSGTYSRLLLKIVRGDARPLSSALAMPGVTSSFHTLHARLQILRDSSTGRRYPLSIALCVPLVLCVLIPLRLVATRAANSTPLAPLVALPPVVGAEDVADIPAFKTIAGGNRDKQYLLIGARNGAIPPPEGYRLLVVLPGGDGGASFNYFVRRIRQNCLGDNYIVAELIGKEWDPRQANSLVWPTRTNPWPTMRFSTEEFAASVVADVEARFPINQREVYSFSWASGGPGGYALSLAPQTPIVGSFIAMSTFPRSVLPRLASARGHSYFLLHPDDAPMAPIEIARTAEDVLRQNGANVRLEAYSGGYGWNGDVYGEVARGIRYLETHGKN